LETENQNGLTKEACTPVYSSFHNNKSNLPPLPDTNKPTTHNVLALQVSSRFQQKIQALRVVILSSPHERCHALLQRQDKVKIKIK
jgi:hypothetical protein